MAGHSKWHNIRYKKAIADAKKSKIYAKIARLITIAAQKGADPKMNPMLEQALQKAKYNSLPKDVIEKAIKKGSGEKTGESFEEVMYEGYGPGGVAILVRALTSNRNRTVSSLRSIFQKGGGIMAEAGSVAWQFTEKGVIIVDGIVRKEYVKGNETEFVDPYDIQKVETDMLSLPIEDIEIEEGSKENDEGGFVKVITTKENFLPVLREIEAQGYHIKQASLEYVSQHQVQVDDEVGEKNVKLIEMLEEDDDVDNVRHNMA